MISVTQAKRKPGPMPSLGATHPSHPDNIKTTSPLKPLPDKVKTESKPHPLPGTKRKASSESEEGSDSEEKRDDDEDFKVHVPSMYSSNNLWCHFSPPVLRSQRRLQ